MILWRSPVYLKFTLIYTHWLSCFYSDEERKMFTLATLLLTIRCRHCIGWEKYESKARILKNKSLNSLNIQFTFSICLKKGSVWSIEDFMVLHCIANEFLKFFFISFRNEECKNTRWKCDSWQFLFKCEFRIISKIEFKKYLMYILCLKFLASK